MATQDGMNMNVKGVHLANQPPRRARDGGLTVIASLLLVGCH